MISKTAEYALRIMVLLARQEFGSFLTGESIAKAARIPVAYLPKIVQLLGKAGLVRAQKGKLGGYVLNRTAEAISLYDIVDAVEPDFLVLKCPFRVANLNPLCPLNKRLSRLYGEMRKAFQGCLLNELIENAKHGLVQLESCSLF